ncbi:MAG TPA: type II secretion system F family protein [Phycisphaerae bacterium]|nr:type II secretion system F family protein [Phycisphaerales bacterium]HNO79579.1 type II secretion system F family protein [Phycisphaerae bacterium]
MPWFEYECMTRAGTAVSGKLEARDHAHAMESLAQMNLDVREVKPADKPPPPAIRISNDDLIFFNEQLASMADAGIALDQGLAQMAQDLESPALRRWVQALVADLRAGATVEQALARHESQLPILYSEVIKAGVKSGDLSSTLFQLNQHLRLTKNTRRVLWESISYPLMVLTIGLAVISFFFMVVVPPLKEIFADFDTRLPNLTLLMITIGDYYPTILVILGAIVLSMILVWQFMRFTPTGRDLKDSFVLSFPIIGRVYSASLLARFMRSVASAVASNIPLPDSLRLGADATGCKPLMRDARTLAAVAEQGRSIFEASQSTRMVPPLFGYCVQSAKSRDALPQSLNSLAAAYEDRAIHSQSMIRVVLFPIMIVVVGMIMGVGAFGAILPLISLVQSMSGG